jgi:hypothetical protein
MQQMRPAQLEGPPSFLHRPQLGSEKLSCQLVFPASWPIQNDLLSPEACVLEWLQPFLVELFRDQFIWAAEPATDARLSKMPFVISESSLAATRAS